MVFVCTGWPSLFLACAANNAQKKADAESAADLYNGLIFKTVMNSIVWHSIYRAHFFAGYYSGIDRTGGGPIVVEARSATIFLHGPKAHYMSKKGVCRSACPARCSDFATSHADEPRLRCK
jgi:hypothetical protein